MALIRTRLDYQDIQIAAYGRAYMGERVTGDGVVLIQHENLLFITIIDALGHGLSAHRAARQAETFLSQSWQSDPFVTLLELNNALQGSIGAAAGIAVLDTKTHHLSYAGVGNTVLRTFNRKSSRLLSTDGIVGGHLCKPRLQSQTLDDKEVLLMYSDGVSDRFDLEDYPQLLTHSPAAVARKVVDKFGKNHDDATCIAMRYRR